MFYGKSTLGGYLLSNFIYTYILDILQAMNDREEWRERVRDIFAGGTTWWWWWNILSSTERLFRWITTLQCVETRKMVPAEIKTRLTLRQSDISSLIYRQSQRKRRDFLGIYSYVSYRLPVCSVHEKSFAFTGMWQPTITRSSAQATVRSVYIVIHR